MFENTARAHQSGLAPGEPSASVPQGEHDDYALTRVPAAARYPWWSVAVQRFGQLSALSQFLLGAALGFGMNFWDAVLAIALGAVLLEIVAIFTGIIGQREGLSTTTLARWTGFGRHGSSLIALVIALSFVGWFGVQSGVSAAGLYKFLPFLPEWAWALAFGLAVTAVVVGGFGSMAWVAYATVPAFLLLAGWSIFTELATHDLASLTSSPAPGPVLSLGAGATLVAGGFIVGMVATPDMSRFNRTSADVIKQTIIGVTIGEFMVCLAGVLLAHALRTDDIITIVTSSSGVVGTLVIVAGTLKINDWNLYSGTLGIVNFFQSVFGVRVQRVPATWVVGSLGSLLAAGGILARLTDFLTLLGILMPPVAAIMAMEYYVVRTWRRELSASAPGLPASEPTWIPGAIAVWVLAALAGQFIPWGIASVNSLIVVLVIYPIFARLGLLKPTAVAPTTLSIPD
ncbi:MAG: cytosine permease [Candidatus Binatia bacterium]